MLKHRKDEYLDVLYSQMQVRDSVKGSSSVKRKNELYLPMPSGMYGAEAANRSQQQYRGKELKEGGILSIQNMPWYHSNPAYSAYLQRARFPDITAPILRGIIGIATKTDAEFTLPPSLKHMEQIATVCNKSLIDMYAHSLNEVMQSGKMCFAVSFAAKDGIKIALYSAERHIDWDEELVDGELVLTRALFVEEFSDDETDEKTIEYKLVNNIAVIQRYTAGKADGDEEPLLNQGKTLDRLPVFFATATDNKPEVDSIPLLGVSDIAMTMFRKDADLAQSQYFSCNPTLFIFGIQEDEKPMMIGSTVAVTISNEAGSAMYPNTDTSALDHIKEHIKDLREEAVSMGAQFLNTGGKGAESAEALSIREASSGATLISIVRLVSKAIETVLDFAAGLTESTAEFKGATDFANHKLSAQELTTLVSSWVQNAISHDTLLNNMRDANIIDKDIDNQTEKDKIAVEREEEFELAETMISEVDKLNKEDRVGGEESPDKDKNKNNKLSKKDAEKDGKKKAKKDAKGGGE